MKRSTLMRRTSMRKPLPALVKTVHTPGTGRGVHTPASDAVVDAPKRGVVRSKALREAYRLIPCQWPVGDLACGLEDGTVCCAHSNWGEHGKGGAMKADDSRAAGLCFRHHTALDQGKDLTGEQKRACFDIAHRRSVLLLVERGLWPKDVAVPEEHRS